MPQRATNPLNSSDDADEQLLKSAAAGHPRAFHDLVDRHAQRMFRTAVSLVGNLADAEDVLQEAWVGAYRNAGTYRGGASVKTWLTRILVLQAAKWRRDRNRAVRRTETLPEQLPANRAEGGSVSIDLQSALQRLSEEHRQVLVLREFEGLSYDELAEVLDVPRGTIESRLYRARADLREKLKAYQP